MFPQRIWLGCLRQLALSNKRRLGHTASETPPQYDVSEKMRKLFEIKQKQREASKEYFRKIIMNPYRPKEDTVPVGIIETLNFDPVLFRYNALMTCHDEYIKLTAKNTALLIVVYCMPILLLAWWLTYSRGELEKKYRAGEIAPKDRLRGLL